ncbi:winged helix-turn-helix transcriptional regulator [Actinokineospora cianjurensis]|uniref:HxlR family transcriptional regulator n=1 Tax=Actinokineospora cianjurensis TaxID=585224 RepID=A0A421B6B3_9PSEU|nr:helix-turn-helix domain-containing protein [Actinokineospora cianjurensis]RLK59760.1 HxlR family transcriptional regulator [Actinokineospora cianjurensis]
MRRTSFAQWPCSIARAMDLLGDQWTLLVLRETYLGVRRFDRIQAELGIARNTLTERLDRLVGAGLLHRERYQERPVRYEYVLTDMGRDFWPALAAIMHWGERWLVEDRPVRLRHRTCGHETHAVVTCASCGDPLLVREVEAEQFGARSAMVGGARSAEGVERSGQGHVTPNGVAVR